MVQSNQKAGKCEDVPGQKYLHPATGCQSGCQDAKETFQKAVRQRLTTETNWKFTGSAEAGILRYYYINN